MLSVGCFGNVIYACIYPSVSIKAFHCFGGGFFSIFSSNFS